MSKPHSSPPIIHALAAMIGSVSSFLVFYPFERLRVEIQSRSDLKEDHHDHGPSKNNSNSSYKNSKTIHKSPNIWKLLIILHRKNQLYYGVSSFTWAIAISNFIFFYAHEVVKSILPLEDDNNFAIKTFLASNIAASINVLLTNPLWVANMRIINDGNNQKNCQYESIGPFLLFQYIRKISKKEGITQLWNGTITSLLLICNPVIQKLVYDTLRHRLLQRQQTAKSIVLKPVEAFLLGAISKAIATILTYPLQLTQVLLRMQQKNCKSTFNKYPSKTNYSGTVDCLLKLHASGGIPALFRGVNAKLLQTVLTSAFTFLTYEQIIDALIKVYNATHRGTCKV